MDSSNANRHVERCNGPVEVPLKIQNMIAEMAPNGNAGVDRAAGRVSPNIECDDSDEDYEWSSDDDCCE